ncbi:DUF2771 domain-containing protein [Nocardia panacis]|uniref:DUF2771 domain-containing protein n=1 Tax=Nocardia panacis TaxID=2340916 RepID=A0A3A4KNF2_9NOCA|nr:DUF2771 domain-containing protein [Nocardia panacis]RJO78793.1 DUF2771 domain-containing protein [Nocardia panacis]
MSERSAATRKPSTRTIVALVVAALVVGAAAFVGILALAVHRAPERDPQITAYAHGRAITVAPYEYCTVRMQDCRHGETAQLPVPSGYPLQISLPKQVTEAPWLAQLIYELPTSERVARVISHADYAPGTVSLTIPSRPEPGLHLIGVEFQLPILARDVDTGREFYLPHARWSINTPY